MPLAGPVCPYCKATAVLSDASAVYGPAYSGRFNLWTCANYPECDAYVGVHRNSPNAAPLGTLARPALRKLRMRVHGLLDEIWRGAAGHKPKLTRTQTYAWFAHEMTMEPGRCHVSWFTDEECLKALSILTEREPTKIQCPKKSHSAV